MDSPPCWHDRWDLAAIQARYRDQLRAGASLMGACDTPRRLHHYAGVTDPLVLAASVLRAVSGAHALLDGNKRASVCLADEFLGLHDLHLDGDPLALAQVVWDIAADPGAQDAHTVAELLRPFLRTGVAAPLAERMPEMMENLAR